MAKRVFDFVVSGTGLVLLAPLFLVIALAVRWDSPGPVFFRQERVGLHGKTFLIHKFRTMVVDGEMDGPQITIGEDPRLTRAGSFLRKHKLDELAQLLDVFVGSMSLVGPRPEVPRYVACYPAGTRDTVLSVKPGITDWASIKYKDESEILASSSDPKKAYLDEVLPVKIRYYVDYVENRSFVGDLRIIWATLLALIR